jgi:ketosteroid isomerase-like protein
MKTKTTSEVIEQFNRAFEQHDASLLTDLVGEECVMESVEPAPDGTRYVGRDVNLTFWQNLANNKDGAFAAEEIAIFGDRATIRWRFRFGPGLSQSIRGVTLMRVRDGKIVEALAYSKSGDTPVANAVRSAGSPDELQAKR